MTVNWVRNQTAGQGLARGSVLMATIPRGGILRRIHYGWTCRLVTSTRYSALNVLDTQVALAVLTGYPDNTYVVPNVLTTTTNGTAPQQHFLRWEMRALEPITWGQGEDDVVTWKDSGPVAATDSEAPVTAATPVGQNLGVFIGWAPTRSDFPGAGYASVAIWWSLMYTT
jgi:hypothetical protein